jgi:hypothetical protein
MPAALDLGSVSERGLVRQARLQRGSIAYVDLALIADAGACGPLTSKPILGWMPYRLLADLVLIFHAGFVLFVVLGGLLTLRWPRMAWVHLPVVLWGAGIEFVGGICPLTPLENHWRRLAGEQGYSGGFVDHYVIAFLYPDGLTRTHQIIVGLFVLALNVAIYAWALRRRRAQQRSGTRLVP